MASATTPAATTMLAGVADHHGDRFDLRQVPLPKPGTGQALVKIIASGVCHVSTKCIYMHLCAYMYN
jgi:propanol-preferring alcohol dehydrogenase